MHPDIPLEELLKMPIELPKNPLWEVTKRFGRDETFALAMNVIGTGAVDAFFNSKLADTLVGPVSKKTQKLMTASAGTIIEKSGFFPGNFRDAWKEYKATPKYERLPFSAYFKKGLKSSSKSLIEDVLFHDTLYVGMMYAGLTYLPMVHPTIIAASSFLIAVGIVAAGEVGAVELWYNNYKKNLRKVGFTEESYLESRFLISKDARPEEIHQFFEDGQTYGLDLKDISYYKDRYFNNQMPDFNGRIGNLRFRKRRNAEGRIIDTAQIVYKTLSEISQKHPDQFRFFPQYKQKLYKIDDGAENMEPQEMTDKQARRIIKRAIGKNNGYSDIHFERTSLYNKSCITDPENEVYHQCNGDKTPNGIIVTTDRIEDSCRPFYVLEIKTYGNKGLLVQAMRDVMRNFPFIQTTHGKKRLSQMYRMQTA